MSIQFRVLAITMLLLVAMGASAQDRGEATPENAAATAALDQARSDVKDVQTRLDKARARLENEYRTLEEIIRSSRREGEAEQRATIRDLKAQRDELWVARERANLLVSQREAELEAVQTMEKIRGLESAGDADAAEIRKLQKKHEKALARAQRLVQESEAVVPPAAP